MNKMNLMTFKKNKKGRDADFKCIYCEKFVSYDRRKTNVNCITEGHFDIMQEQWHLEEVVEMSHKHCATLAKKST